MAQKRRLAVAFVRGQAGPSCSSDAAILPEPEPEPHLKSADVLRLRGQADALAMRMQYHDQALHNRLMPPGDDARKVFGALEQARVEAVGARVFPGAGQNMAALHEQNASNLHGVTERDPQHMAQAITLLARERFHGEKLPKAAEEFAQCCRAWLDAQAPGRLD